MYEWKDEASGIAIIKIASFSSFHILLLSLFRINITTRFNEVISKQCEDFLWLANCLPKKHFILAPVQSASVGMPGIYELKCVCVYVCRRVRRVFLLYWPKRMRYYLWIGRIQEVIRRFMALLKDVEAAISALTRWTEGWGRLKGGSIESRSWCRVIKTHYIVDSVDSAGICLINMWFPALIAVKFPFILRWQWRLWREGGGQHSLINRIQGFFFHLADEYTITPTSSTQGSIFTRF